MKFSEHLGSHLTPEWRSQYVPYDEMKKFLYEAAEKAPLSDEVNSDILKHHFEKYDHEFFLFCDKELQKVNTFFAEKLSEAIRRFNEVELEIANTGIERLQDVARRHTLFAENIDKIIPLVKEKTVLLTQKRRHFTGNKQKLNEMKFVVGELYLSFILIQNFQQLNFTAFRKILKKHDKVFKTTTGMEYRVENIETAPFYVNKHIDKLIHNTETIAIEDLEHGDRAKAMKRLRVPPLAEKQKSSAAFFWGLFTGMWIVLFGIIITSAYSKHYSLPFSCNENRNATSTDVNDFHHSWEPTLRMYRGFLLVFIMTALLGVNVHGWRKGGVNHVLIFELDPRNYLSATELLMIASLFGALWSLSCVLFLIGENLFPVYVQPAALALFVLLFLMNPTRTFWYRSRRWLLRILFRIICAPFFPVKFADFWLADQLNSLVVALRDFEYLICFYSFDLFNDNACICTNPKINFMRPIIALLPAWFRFAQCIRRYYDTRKGIPHLVNAGKYFTSILVTVFSTISSTTEGKNNFKGTFTILWIFCLFTSTLYSLFWDIRMDWGLFAKNSGENVFLREQIVYNYKAYYYLAIIGDVFLRFLKPLTVSVVDSGFVHHEFLVLFLAVCEVIRRFIWNYFRLENEHLNNVGEFRAVRDISIKPMESNHNIKKEFISLEQTMDSDIGPLPNRKVVEILLDSSASSIQLSDSSSSGVCLRNKKREMGNSSTDL